LTIIKYLFKDRINLIKEETKFFEVKGKIFTKQFKPTEFNVLNVLKKGGKKWEQT